MLDGKVIDQAESPREILQALERGDYQLPPDVYSTFLDVEYVRKTSCGGCGACCDKKKPHHEE